MKMYDDDDEVMMNEVHEVLLEQLDELLNKYNSMMVAGAMMCNAIRIYKMILTQEGFDRMMRLIHDTANEINEFKPPTIQ